MILPHEAHLYYMSNRADTRLVRQLFLLGSKRGIKEKTVTTYTNNIIIGLRSVVYEPIYFLKHLNTV